MTIITGSSGSVGESCVSEPEPELSVTVVTVTLTGTCHTAWCLPATVTTVTQGGRVGGGMMDGRVGETAVHRWI